jgi:hypothetical protein
MLRFSALGTTKARHSKHECSEAERVIWNPDFSQRVDLVAAKAGFQIAHFAALRFAFGMTGFGSLGFNSDFQVISK